MSEKRSRAGRKSRHKGKRHENQLAHTFNRWAALPNNDDGSFKRHWSGRLETKVGGDLQVPEWFEPFVIEARNREGWSFSALLENGKKSTLIKWWRELKAKNDNLPMIMVFTRNNLPNYVMWGRDENAIFLSFPGYALDVPTMSFCLPDFGVTIAKLDDFLKCCPATYFQERHSDLQETVDNKSNPSTL